MEGGNFGGRHAESIEWLERATWAFAALGLLVRMVRYLVVYPIWHDEAFLAVNFLDRGYRDLLRPLGWSSLTIFRMTIHRSSNG
jgi:hypothetical protein